MNDDQFLAQRYLVKAAKRLQVLEVLMQEESYSDVVCHARETVELALKGMLRHVGVEPPRQRDVGGLIVKYRGRFPSKAARNACRLADISRWLNRENGFDLRVTGECTRKDGERAVRDTVFVVAAAWEVIPL